MTTPLNVALQAALTYIAGHTHTEFKIDKFEAIKPTETKLMFRATTNVIDVARLRNPVSLIMRRLWIVITGEVTADKLPAGELADDFPTTDQDVVVPPDLRLVENQGGIGTINCLYLFETPDGGQKNVVLNMSFRKGYLYHVG